jgi:hypothetical protein
MKADRGLGVVKTVGSIFKKCDCVEKKFQLQNEYDSHICSDIFIRSIIQNCVSRLYWEAC